MTECTRPRSRPLLCMLIAMVILTGRASRKYPSLLPALFGKYPGDALWALMVLLGWALVSPRLGTGKLAFFALVTSCAVEFSQLYQAAWINAIRSTTVGHLVLGSTFSWFDMLAYSVGIGLGVLVEVVAIRLMTCRRINTLNEQGRHADVKRWFRSLSASLLIVCCSVLYLADATVGRVASGRLAKHAEDIEGPTTVLLLGTAPEVNGKPNFFYTERIHAVLQLWKLGKVDAVLISGDNSRANYNEPAQMKADLVKGGIPPERLVCDYAGRHTLDSITRARNVFGSRHVVIVSQREHVERALYLAQAIGLQAQGFAAADAPHWWQVRQHLREMFARVKALLDATTH